MRSITEVLTPRATPALEYRRRWERRYHSRITVTDVVVVAVTAAVGATALILVLDHGRVIAQGSHEELLATSDTYREIVASQGAQEEAA